VTRLMETIAPAERVLTFAILTMNYKVLNNYSRMDKYNVEE